MNLRKLTPISIIIYIALAILVPYGIYFLFINNRGGAGLAGLFAGIISFGCVLVLLLERITLRAFEPSRKKIWITESVIIVVVIIIYVMMHAKFFFRVSDNVHWFVVVNTAGKTTGDINYQFPNHKVMNIGRDIVVYLNAQDISGKETDVEGAGKVWDGYSSRGEVFSIGGKPVNCIIYSRYDYELTEHDFSQIKEQLGRR